jgi:hypothetical protein
MLSRLETVTMINTSSISSVELLVSLKDRNGMVSSDTILVFEENSVINQKNCIEHFARIYSSYYNIEENNLQIVDDGFRLHHPKGVIGICPQSHQLFAKRLDDYINGRNIEGTVRPWTLGSYWIPEVFIKDLLNYKVQKFNDDTLRKETSYLLESVKSLGYPKKLRESVMKFTKDEINIKISMLAKADLLQHRLSVSQVILAYCRYWFAKNQILPRKLAYELLPEEESLKIKEFLVAEKYQDLYGILKEIQ